MAGAVSSVAHRRPSLWRLQSNAARILDDIETKLRRQVAKENLPLSVHGQVAQLINCKEAISQPNLAQMCIG